MTRRYGTFLSSIKLVEYLQDIVERGALGGGKPCFANHRDRLIKTNRLIVRYLVKKDSERHKAQHPNDYDLRSKLEMGLNSR